ncbi:MAG: PQQ-binding-like beta-propeller repeat protein [Opitutaceae bacterium]|nr:PQQ-binding-like beta-propeller repeat protein [Opitutaceae bacterium]
MRSSTLLFACFLLAATARAENWPNWRGPAHNGSSPEKNLPAKFSKTAGVKWAVEMPGSSAGTPVIWGERVFVTAADTRSGKQAALCLDRRTGAQLWRADISEFTTDGQYSNSCSPSAVTDGKLAVFFFGTGELVGFDVAGKKLWERNLAPFAFQWTFSSSPLLHEGQLIMQVLQRDVAVRGRGKPTGNESYLLAIDPATGRDLWRALRPSEAVAESREAFSTPLPFVHNGRAELVVVGGDCITGHDPKNGAELWRWGTWNPTKIGHWRLVPSPATDGRVILACGPKNAPVYAVKAGGHGTLTHQQALAWQSHVQPTEDPAEAAPTKNERDLTADVPTPLFYEGKFYILNGTKRKLFCVDPADGSVIWSGDLGGRSVFQASPTAADGKIYVMNFDADVSVIQAGGPAFKLLHKASFKDDGDDTRHRSSIAIAQGNLYVRTGTKLFCLGK